MARPANVRFDKEIPMITMRWRADTRLLGPILAATVAACALCALPVTVDAQSGGGSDERAGNIKVRGHWLIDVRERDGTLVAQREFDNALTPAAPGYIARTLTRTNSLSLWEVEIGSSGGNGPCAGRSFSVISGNSSCFIVDSSIGSFVAFVGTAAFATGTTAVGGPGGSQMILTGNFTVATAGQINRVATRMNSCDSLLFSVASCRITAPGDVFTSHDLTAAQGPGAPLAVDAGQVIQVTVTISFCSSEGCV
jgi:hypothetical protein